MGSAEAEDKAKQMNWHKVLERRDNKQVVIPKSAVTSDPIGDKDFGRVQMKTINRNGNTTEFKNYNHATSSAHSLVTQYLFDVT